MLLWILAGESCLRGKRQHPYPFGLLEATWRRGKATFPLPLLPKGVLLHIIFGQATWRGEATPLTPHPSLTPPLRGRGGQGKESHYKGVGEATFPLPLPPSCLPCPKQLGGVRGVAYPKGEGRQLGGVRRRGEG